MSYKYCNFRCKHVFDRMNFLYQASQLMSKTDKVAASFYANSMMICAKRTVSKIDPEIKRIICKSCQSPLIPGETAKVRLKKRSCKEIKMTCLLCQTDKRIVSKKGYKLWLECPESVANVLRDSLKSESSNKESPNNLESNQEISTS